MDDDLLTRLDAECSDYAANGDYAAYHRIRYMGWRGILREAERWSHEVGRRDRHALDIGPGYGDISVALVKMGFQVSALDYCRRLPEAVCQRYGIVFALGHVEVDPLPFADNTFDLVVFTEILEHLNFSPLKPLGEIRRVLKSGGGVIITTPNVGAWRERWMMLLGRNIYPPLEAYLSAPLSYKGVPFYDRHTRLYTLKETVWLCQQVGLEVRTAAYLASRRYPTSLLSYLTRGVSWLKDAIPSLRKTLLVTATKPPVPS